MLQRTVARWSHAEKGKVITQGWVSPTSFHLSQVRGCCSHGIALMQPWTHRTKPRLILLADSDAESSSAGSSDEEDIVTAEPAGAPGERVLPPGTEG